MTTIAEKLTTIKNALTAIKNSIISKGQTPTGDITTYATAILNIGGGGVTVNNQDKTITENGSYTADEGYTGLGTVTVNVEGSSSDFVGIPREVNSSGVYGYPTENFTFSLPSNATDIGDNVLGFAFLRCYTLVAVDLSSLQTISGSSSMYSAFSHCTALASVDLSSLQTISGIDGMSSTFDNCTSLSSADLSSLQTISGNYGMNNTFYNCTSLSSVNLSSLTTISGEEAMYNTFYNCTSLSSADLSSLTTISGSYEAMYNTFYNCTSLSSVNLSSLTTISGEYAMKYAFKGCTALTELSFPALTSNSFGSYTNQFNNMLQGVTGCTVHFPSNLESKIGSWRDVTSGFGGNSTQILFDLPATE